MSSDRFKFRAWCEKFKVYAPISGSLSIPGEPYNIAFDPVHISADGRLYVVSNYDGKEVCQVDDVTECYTIEQCTGLKDCKGKLIYEGDVVKVILDGMFECGMTFAVISGMACWQIRDLVDNQYHYLDNGRIFEIIGNIHEMELAK